MSNKSLRPKHAAELLGIGPATLWRWVNEKKAEGFPQPIRLSARCTVFDQDSLLAWRDGRQDTFITKREAHPNAFFQVPTGTEVKVHWPSMTQAAQPTTWLPPLPAAPHRMGDIDLYPPSLVQAYAISAMETNKNELEVMAFDLLGAIADLKSGMHDDGVVIETMERVAYALYSRAAATKPVEQKPAPKA